MWRYSIGGKGGRSKEQEVKKKEVEKEEMKEEHRRK